MDNKRITTSPDYLGAALRLAMPKNTAKLLETELGCSRRQAQRIAWEGRIPRHLRERLIALLDSVFVRLREELAVAERDIKAMRDQEMLARIQSRRDPRALAGASKISGQARGPGSAVVRKS